MSIEIKKEKYLNLGIHLVGSPKLADVEHSLTDSSTLKNSNGVKVYIDERQLHKYLPLILQLNYKFHHYYNREYVYYKWLHPTVPDKIPEWATRYKSNHVR
jgi:hypothetical protein